MRIEVHKKIRIAIQRAINFQLRELTIREILIRINDRKKSNASRQHVSMKTHKKNLNNLSIPKHLMSFAKKIDP